MLKKRLLTIGVLAVVCFAAQLLLQPALSRAEQTAPVQNQKILTTPANAENIATAPCQIQTNLIRRLLWILLSTAVVIFAAWWLCKKMSCRWTGPGGKFISRLDTLSIGPRNSICLVQVGNKKFLLSAGPDSVRMLADVSEAIAGTKTL